MGLDPENVRLGFFGLNGVARMADGASLEQVRAELGAMLSNLEELLPDQPGAPIMASEYRPLIVPLRTWMVGDIEATLWILLGAVGLLLLIACANVANLFLVRAEALHGEVTIRAVLGASRGRLVVSVLRESLALGVAGGLAALLLAQGAVRLLARFGPRELPRLEEISIDTNVLLFGLAVSLAAGLLLGLLPAWHANAVAASGHMTAGAHGATSARDRQLVRRVRWSRIFGQSAKVYSRAFGRHWNGRRDDGAGSRRTSRSGWRSRRCGGTGRCRRSRPDTRSIRTR